MAVQNFDFGGWKGRNERDGYKICCQLTGKRRSSDLRMAQECREEGGYKYVVKLLSN